MTADRVFALPYDEVLRRTSQRTPELGAGATSAMTCAAATALVMMAARYAGSIGEPVLASTGPLLSELADLADGDAELVEELLAAWQRPASDPGRAEAVAAGARRACAVPRRVAEIAEVVCGHAEMLVRHGKTDLVGDALTALYLAQASGQSATSLVRINSRQVT